jgi:hypothetical protein
MITLIANSKWTCVKIRKMAGAIRKKRPQGDPGEPEESSQDKPWERRKRTSP